MEQRLATGEHHDRGTALIYGIEALVDAQALIEDGVRIIDLATAGASEVTTEQGLQHQNQRIPSYTFQVPTDNIGAYADHLAQRDGHEQISSKI
jgi:hypothetical protein